MATAETLRLIKEQRKWVNVDGHSFLVPLKSSFTLEDLEEEVERRTRETWLWKPLGHVRVRYALYIPMTDKFRYGASDISYHTTKGLVNGGMLIDSSRIWKLWYESDIFESIPSPILSIFVGLT